jgi:putative ABC transport system permease protein
MLRLRLCAVVLACTVAFAAVASTGLSSQATADAPAILMSRQLLESQGLTVGDIVSLAADPSGAGARPFRIAGEYEPTPDPMQLGAIRNEVRLHLPDLMSLETKPGDPLDGESVDAINLSLSGSADVAGFARDIAGRLPGVVVQSTTGTDGRVAPFVVLERFHLAIAVVTILASSIFLLALMLMLLDERRATVGILRLIGFNRRRILLYVLAEGLVVAAAGAVVGVLLSAAFEGGINRFFQWRYDTALVFVRITPGIALQSLLVAVPLGVLATLAASWALLRTDAFSFARR